MRKYEASLSAAVTDEWRWHLSVFGTLDSFCFSLPRPGKLGEQRRAAGPADDRQEKFKKHLFSPCPAPMIEVVCNDRLGKKVRVKCNEDDTIGDLKLLIAAQTGTRPEKLRIQKWYTVYKDHITLEDYEIHDGMGLELYYN